MRAKDGRRRALAVMAAVAGTGLIPGRALALFFGQMKSTRWAGVFAASALFGAMVGFAGWWRGRSAGVEGPTGALERLTGLLGRVFAALAIALMLERAGALGALVLPMKRAYPMGALIAAALALPMALAADRALPALGASALAATLAFYGALAADPRPVRLYVRCVTVLSLAGSLRSALLLATLFAAMNGCAAGWAVQARTALRPAEAAKLGVRVGLAMLCAVSLGCLALERGGDALLAQAMPWTILSARWGIVGFWTCAGVEFLCALSTLAAALGELIASLRRGKGHGLPVLAASLLLFGVMSRDRLT